MAYVELHLSEVITPPRDLSPLRRLDPKPANVNMDAIMAGRWSAGLKAAEEAKAKARASAEYQARKALIEEAARARGCTPARILARIQEHERKARIKAERINGRGARMAEWSRSAHDPITIDAIVDCACAFYKANRGTVVLYSKDSHICMVRHVAWFIIHETFPSITRVEIARIFGGRNHSTTTRTLTYTKRPPNAI